MLSPEIESVRLPIAIAWLTVLVAWESIFPFFTFFRSRVTERAVHGFRNLFIGLINNVMIGLFFTSLWAWASLASQSSGFGLLHRVDIHPALHALMVVLVFDAWTYAWHRMNHQIPFLWRFHRMHHSDPTMDVTTATRFHVGEITLSSVLRIPIIYVLGAHVWELVLFETAMFFVVQFHHANIGLPDKWDRLLRIVIVTPSMHKVHHSRYQPETDSNFTALFSFWDRIGRTFRLHPDPHTIQFGLDGFDTKREQGFTGLFLTPMKRMKKDQSK